MTQCFDLHRIGDPRISEERLCVFQRIIHTYMVFAVFHQTAHEICVIRRSQFFQFQHRFIGKIDHRLFGSAVLPDQNQPGIECGNAVAVAQFGIGDIFHIHLMSLCKFSHISIGTGDCGTDLSDLNRIIFVERLHFLCEFQHAVCIFQLAVKSDQTPVFRFFIGIIECADQFAVFQCFLHIAEIFPAVHDLHLCTEGIRVGDIFGKAFQQNICLICKFATAAEDPGFPIEKCGTGG